MGNLHFSDTASELIMCYIPDREKAMYAGYFLVAALHRAERKEFPSECEVYHWAAKGLCEDIKGNDLHCLKEKIKDSGFLLELMRVKEHLMIIKSGTVNTYRLTRSGEELARRLLPLMECLGN